MFIADIGYTQEVVGDHAVGSLEVTDHLRVPGHRQVRPSVLATLADVYTGVLASRQTAPLVALTLDLTVRTLGEGDDDRLEVDAWPLKVGRTTLVYESEFRASSTGELQAVSYVTFVASPRPEDVMAPAAERTVTTSTFDRPFAEALGARVADGVVEIGLRPYVEQSTGSMQGGVIALLAELAGESFLGAPVADLELRYLSSVRVGPGRTVTRGLDASTARVEVRDAGRDDRLCALAFVRTART